MFSTLLSLFRLDGYRVFRFLFLPNQGAFVLAIALATLSLGLESFSLVALIPLLDAIDKGQPQLAAFGLSIPVKWALPCIVVLILCKIVLNFLSRFIPISVSSRVAAGIRSQILQDLLVLRERFAARVNTGDTVKRIDNNVYTATGAFHCLVQILAGSLTIAVFFVLMLLISPKLSILAAVFFGVMHLVTHYINTSITRSSANLAADAKTFFPQVLDIARAAPIIRSFGAESFFKARAQSRIESMRADEVRFLTCITGIAHVSELSSFLFLIFSFLLLWSGVISTSFATFLVFFYTAYRAIANLKEVLVSRSELVKCRDHASLVEPLLASDVPVALPRPLDAEHAGLALREGLELVQVGYSYGAGKLVLSDLNLKVSRGEKIAILGESGAGKSTLLLILLGLERPSAGRILVDGCVVDSPQQMSSLSCYVSQEPYVFKLSIAENVAMSPTFEEGRVRGALEQANLWPYVNALPAGIHTAVGDGDLDMSVGQKQRLVIARALYKDADLLLMDEPTSALDPENGRQVMREIFSLFRDKTIIAVTHSHEFLPLFDMTYVLKEGRVAAGKAVLKSAQ
jgi:subfamily B ATP-binding cassette protein MsbA